MTRQPVMTRRIQLFIMVALTIFTYLYYYKIYKRMVPDSGGCGCFELFEFDGGISGQSRAPGRCFNYLPGRCPLGWSNWAFRGGSVYFLVYFSGRCSGKSMANPWQILQPIHSLCIFLVYVPSCKRWHNYWVWKITIFQGKTHYFYGHCPVHWGSHGFFRRFDPKGLSSLNPELRIVYAYAHRHKYTVTYIYIIYMLYIYIYM